LRGAEGRRCRAVREGRWTRGGSDSEVVRRNDLGRERSVVDAPPDHLQPLRAVRVGVVHLEGQEGRPDAVAVDHSRAALEVDCSARPERVQRRPLRRGTGSQAPLPAAAADATRRSRGTRAKRDWSKGVKTWSKAGCGPRLVEDELVIDPDSHALVRLLEPRLHLVHLYGCDGGSALGTIFLTSWEQLPLCVRSKRLHPSRKSFS